MPRTTRTTLSIAATLCAATIVPSLAAGSDCTTYGAGVTVERATPVATILAAPGEWEGKTVRVEGEVREVCPMAGCWLSIVAGTGEASLRVKVEDGQIVFPLSARGRRAVAEGTVTVDEMDRARYASWLEHLAAERGQAFDPASVGDGPYRRVEVQATGAEVCTGG